MAEALGVPQTEHALGDFFLMTKAKKAGIPMEKAVGLAIDTPLGTLGKLLHLSDADFFFYVQRFAEADTDKNGQLQLAEFERALEVEPGDSYVAELFELFDQDGDGVLRYAEFVAGLLYINSKVDDATTARLAFKLFDTCASSCQLIPPVPSWFTRFRLYLAHSFSVFPRLLRVLTRRFQRTPSRNPGPRNSRQDPAGPLRFRPSAPMARIT